MFIVTGTPIVIDALSYTPLLTLVMSDSNPSGIESLTLFVPMLISSHEQEKSLLNSLFSNLIASSLSNSTNFLNSSEYANLFISSEN